nr:MAG TPA: hypothetical protein [Caudoviricetes sp.]
MSSISESVISASSIKEEHASHNSFQSLVLEFSISSISNSSIEVFLLILLTICILLLSLYFLNPLIIIISPKIYYEQ